ncbi:MAG: hypothetical protein IPK71_07065 [Myxococcales bacterium]|nr:hypothetical protein [Myxococcales bacterium]
MSPRSRARRRAARTNLYGRIKDIRHTQCLARHELILTTGIHVRPFDEDLVRTVRERTSLRGRSYQGG